MGKNRQEISQLIEAKASCFSGCLNKIFSKEKLDLLARESGFVQRKSRLDASKFLDLLLFCDQYLDQVSLEDLANGFVEQHGLSISKQAVQERFNIKAVEFMSALLSQLLAGQLNLNPSEQNKFKRFNRVMVKDSTRYTLPEAYAKTFKGHGGQGSKAQISIQYEYDLLTNVTQRLELTAACRNDQTDSRQTLGDIEKGDLLVRDLGYVTQHYLKHVSQQGAYFLNRLNSRWGVQDVDQAPIDFSAILRKLNKHTLPALELEVKIADMPMRMIVAKVPEQVYKQRLLRAERAAHGRHKVSKEYKTRAWLNIFITNVPKAWVSTSQVQGIYRTRWQIELVFKAWKSQARIDKMKAMKQERFQCQLIARFIWIMLHYQAFRLIEQGLLDQGMAIRCSQNKFFKTAFRLSNDLKKVVFEDQPLEYWFKKLLIRSDRKYLTETKNGKQNVFKTINNFLT
ncbi:MAG: IS4 family transposase [Reichenbachiella sp.]|uniref:IS4 family transposase n=1 Tax=Reichenbachiella sp. TaxID=2184521 RepID=UPI0029670B7C|nr:IS4 family transposase [Reichenbachiella sp.]MDW3208313.1 IS4 family transposase [Reichenbachiella sp.]MDW3208452.1 IS4 family transposase [Reichenbachiella sp.]MDW3208537.1 IS4 family transposase [Reichenbachiella sp.]MDW3208623.1 IS4 family transposase [Reichenbachiella sp.]MDW3211590.1 IS4 family transposase [Reichenbachiella sp.]